MISEESTSPTQSIPELASRVLNHEAKLMVFMALSEQATALTAVQLHKRVTEPQKEYETWTPNTLGASLYCRQSLIPADTVSEEQIRLRRAEVRAYRLTDCGRNLAVPAAGFLLDWSLRYPEVSLQNLLGCTNSSGQVRAGETRVRILEGALVSPQGGKLSVRDLFADGVDTDWESVGYKQERTRLSKAVNALATAGVLHWETVEFNDDRELLIVDPRMPEEVATHPNYEVAQALYEVIADLDTDRQNKDSPLLIGYNDAVVQTLRKLSEKGLDVDPQKVRRAVNNAYFSETMYKGITKADSTRFNDGMLTRFRVNDEFRDGLEEFLCILGLLEDIDDRTYQEGLKLLRSIRQNPPQRAQIMRKAFVFSPHAQKKSVLTTAREVESLISDIGQGTINDITTAYREKVGRPIQSESLRNILVLLTSQGRVAVELVANEDKPDYQLKRSRYSLAS